jgi:hemoglobin/transferrin/lactoferrin receptor protein
MRLNNGGSTNARAQLMRRASCAERALWGAGIVLAGIAWGAPAFAQTTLPPLSVQTKKAKAKSAKRAAPRAAPPPAEPAPGVAAGEGPVATSRQDVPYTTPGSVSTATRSDIETFGQIGTDDILRSMPGVSTRQSASNAGVAVNIRGFEGSGRVNMMIDGVRQNFRFTGHEASGFTYIDPNLIAGIEVNSGAVSTRGGAGALAGTADFRTLDIDDIIKPGQNTGVLTTTTWGSNGIGWTGMAAGGARTDTVGVAGAISTRDQGRYKNGDGVTVLNTDREVLSGLFKLEFKPSSEHFLKFGGVFYDGDFTANSYFQNVRSDTFTMNYAYRPSENPWIDFRFNAYKNDVVMRYLRGTGSAVGRVIDVQGAGFDTSNTSRFRIGDVRFVSEYGFEYFGDDFDVINSATSPDFGVNPSGKSSVAGLFSQTKATYGIADLIVGLRYDMFTLKGSGAVAAGNPIGLPAGPYEVDRQDERFNPKVTFVLNPLSWFRPYVTYSETMRYPTVNEAFTGGVHPGDTTNQSFFPNPFLEPEIAKGWEFGFNIKKDGVIVRNDLFRFKAAYFSLDVENYITAFIAPGFRIYYDNHSGTSKVQGIELQGMYDAGFFFAGLSYTYTDSKLPPQINGFGAAAYLPDHVATITGGLRFFDEKLTLGARGYLVSEAEVGAINGSPTPGYELLDLFTSYKFDSGLQIGASVTNVFDEAYTPALSTGASGATGVPTGRGRTFLLNAKAQF